MKRIALIAIVLAGCVDHGSGPQGKRIEASYIRENLLTAVPQDIQPMQVDLGGKVTYLGNKVVYVDGKDPKTPLAPGAAIRVMHYWRVNMPPGEQWRVFAYARGAQGSADFMNFGPTDMEIGYPTKKWKAGQIIQDVQDIVLRPDWRSPTVTLYVGLVEDGKHQIGDRMPATGGNVIDRAIVARTIDVDLSKAPPPQGTVYIPHATGPITIDGMATEPGWSSAATSPELITADGSADPVGKATARMTWDEQNLYLFVSIVDSDVYSQYKNHDEPLWKADCVEVFIDADGNRTGYVELQVNPNNATFDSFFATTRAQPGDEKWDANMETVVKVRGTADKAGDTDQGWDVEIAIPLAAVKGRHDTMAVRLPPEVGDRWRLNVVRVDYRSNGGSPGVASWNRISYSDFHALDKMLTVVFADPSGSIVPKPPGADTGSGGSAGSAAPQTGSAGSAAPLSPIPQTGSATAPMLAPIAPAMIQGNAQGSAVSQGSGAPTTAPTAPAPTAPASKAPASKAPASKAPASKVPAPTAPPAPANAPHAGPTMAPTTVPRTATPPPTLPAATSNPKSP
ncbi:MAG TPA: sugar-binding protein [Kofleriaceae bacterium]|nr:sugar-binding protein [Kofleriaceae bacterium]